MKKNKKSKLILGVIVFAVLIGPLLPGQAAEKQKKNQPPPAQLPIVIQSDKIYVNDTSGEFNASGSVSVAQGQQTMLSDLIRGNSKQSIVWIDDKATFLQPGTKIVGDSAVYNYKDRSGTINQAKGKVEKELVTGQSIDLLPEKVIIHDGTMTKCPAIVPDYHLSAERVEIWPGQKMIAYDVKFWIKNKVILSLPKYQQNLQKKENSFMPRVGYESDDGFYIEQAIGYPINKNVGFYGTLTYYSDSGFKPQYRLEDTEKNYTVGIDYGHYRDIDGYWIKKEPEFNLRFGNRLGNSPISYSFIGQYGKWTDSWKTSWHQDYNLYFYRDPIKFNNGLTLNLGTGFEYVLESYNASTQAMFRYDIGLSKTLSPKFDLWTWYHHVNNNVSLFNYNNIDVGRELVPGITYRPDKHNTFVYYMSYDIANERLAERYYVWNRNLHCWQASIEYRQKEEKLTIKLHTAQF